MWTCQVCDAVVEEDDWEICWKCSSDRNLTGPALESRKLSIAQKATSLRCLRCETPMIFGGTKRFHEGSRVAEMFLGEWAVGRESLDLYYCENCGKVEFFMDGIGDKARGEEVTLD